MKRLIAVLSLAMTLPVYAASPADLTISNAWSRPTATADGSAVIYLVVADTGAPDRLTGAMTPIATSATLHNSTMKDGVMQMRPVAGLDISRAAPITLAPAGYHLMLTGLRQALKAGDTFPLTLNFTTAGPISTMVTVRAPGATKPGDTMPGMSMGH